MGHARKHPYHPHGGNRKLTSLPPSDVLIHLLLSETIFRSGHYLWVGGLVNGRRGAIKVLPSKIGGVKKVLTQRKGEVKSYNHK
jgi:hypothetical protein